MDSLGVGAVKIGRISVPDHCRRRQEAPKRLLATLAVFLRFFVGFLRRGRLWGGMCLFHVLRCCWGVAGAMELVVVVGHSRDLPLLAHLTQWDY